MIKHLPIARKKLILIFTIIFIILLYIAVFSVLRGKIQDFSQIFGKVEEVYSRYGYYLIFIGAMIEATFILGFYIPGSLIVLLGVSLARMGITSFPLVVIIGTLGFCAGYSLNYFIGRYGWYNLIEGFGLDKQISKAKPNLKHHYNIALFWGYMMSNTGSILSTASGILHVPFKEFIIKTFMLQLFWSLVLGGLAYIFGMTFIRIFIVYFGTIAFLSFILFLFRKSFQRRSSSSGS